MNPSVKSHKWIALLIAASCAWMSCITEDSKTASSGPVAPGQAPVHEKADPATLTTMQWMDSVLNQGSILEGTKMEVVFRFKNTGEKPLVIERADASCGCTVAEKPEEPIMPGQEGRIKGIFNSQGRVGANHKTIKIQANTKPSPNHVVEFNVTVVGKTEGPKAAATTDKKAF